MTSAHVHSEAASAHIWARVSGLPGEERRKRLLFMLQAYIDESFSNESSIYAMAGFIASAEKWAAFSDEWSQFLDMGPSIEHFKMNDAMKLVGEFRGWREGSRDEKLKLLMGTIADHTSGAVACVISRDQYESVFRANDLPKQLWSPYYSYSME